MITVLLLISTVAFSQNLRLVDIPGRNLKMLETEVTQKLYKSIMGANPSKNIGDNLPVEMVSCYDAMYFCNKLSEHFGLTPVYSVDGSKDVRTWDYKPHQYMSILGKIKIDSSANGFRLPLNDEWEFAAHGGEDYEFAGSDDLYEVAWADDNSGDRTHPVAQKKANGYGLYDMNGNVMEWIWNPSDDIEGYYRGGSFVDEYYASDLSFKGCLYYYKQAGNLGFRIVRSVN